MADSNETLQGLLLTRQWIESDSGTELIFWFATSNGPLRARVTNQESVCFIPASTSEKVYRLFSRIDGWRLGNTQLKNFRLENVSALYCRSQRQLFDLRDRLARESIPVLEADVKPTDRYLMERFITGSATISGRLTGINAVREMLNPRMEACESRPALTTVSIDIETDYKAEQLYSIALHSDSESTVYMIRHGNNSAPSGQLEMGDGINLQLNYCSDVRELLQQFLARIQQIDPDIYIGWNIVNFDLRCLQKFADGAAVPLTMGRGGSEIGWRQSRDSSERFYAVVPGRAVLDGIELMRTATYQFENFSLEHVARKLLGRGKLVDDVDKRGAEITELFENDQPALARYNLEDCRLVW
ncbi:MAG: 3'-5' exonuclease, partial [Gammaproteobacteria bacterium]